MAPTWTADKLQKLLLLMREHQNDLFIKSSIGTQRKMNVETLDMIAKELNMTSAALKHKYFNLNSAYNMEVKKINEAKKQGFFYRPTLPWFNDFRDIMEKVKETAIENEQKEYRRAPSQESISDEELEEDEDSPMQTSNADTIVVTIKQDYIDGPLKGSRDVDFDEALDSIEIVQGPPASEQKQHARRPAKRQLEKTQDEESCPSPTEPSVPMDEFQMFANHVAEQLRHMNANSARKMQGEIHIIFDEEGFPFDSPVLEDMT